VAGSGRLNSYWMSDAAADRSLWRVHQRAGGRRAGDKRQRYQAPFKHLHHLRREQGSSVLKRRRIHGVCGRFWHQLLRSRAHTDGARLHLCCLPQLHCRATGLNTHLCA